MTSQHHECLSELERHRPASCVLLARDRNVVAVPLAAVWSLRVSSLIQAQIQLLRVLRMKWQNSLFLFGERHPCMPGKSREIIPELVDLASRLGRDTPSHVLDLCRRQPPVLLQPLRTRSGNRLHLRGVFVFERFLDQIGLHRSGIEEHPAARSWAFIWLPESPMTRMK